MFQKRLTKTPLFFIKILLCFCLAIGAKQSIAQVTLASQNAVNNFSSSRTYISGSLNIGGAFGMSGISDLSPLLSINRINGDLTITANGKLTNLKGLGNITTVGGNIYITNNPNLSDCLDILAILSQVAQVGGTIIIDNNGSGCNSQMDIVKKNNTCGNPGNNIDSDDDGTIDCEEDCPFDKNKTSAGTCGCGKVDIDSDGDGTLDCLDACAFDKNKIAPGNCGCGQEETPDSDGDGVFDCKDECPDNPYVSEKRDCGCEAPEITMVRIIKFGDCKNQNTFDPADDTFNAKVRVDFEYPPQLGAIRFAGGTNYRFDFKNENLTQTIFEFDLTFSTNVEQIEFIVEYIGNEGCFYRFTQKSDIAPCSNLVCEIPENINTTITGNKVAINWDYVADYMSYEYRYRPTGRKEWYSQWTDQTGISICDLNINQTYEYGIRSYCGNDRKSTYSNGIFTTENEIMECGFVEESSSCRIEKIEVLKIRKCHDLGSKHQRDDFFYADVLVQFQHPPATGQLKLAGNVNVEVFVEKLQSTSFYSFDNLKLYENNGKIDLTATFSEQEDCSYSINYPIPDNPCWQGRFGQTSNSSILQSPNATFEFSSNEFRISPNPAHDELRMTYRMAAFSAKLDLTIINLYGQKVLHKKVTGQGSNLSIDIHKLEKGIYYVLLSDGQQQISRKLVKGE